MCKVKFVLKIVDKIVDLCYNTIVRIQKEGDEPYVVFEETLVTDGAEILHGRGAVRAPQSVTPMISEEDRN